MNFDLKMIKKHYGEKMMQKCRELFPTILETEGLLFETLSNNLNYSRELINDILDQCKEAKFKEYIESKLTQEEIEIDIDKSVKELLEEAGYDIYECTTEKDIQSFRKYYKTDEELCTFKGGRLNKSYVFFAIKKNVDDINRENFANPKRQDEYGTSVLSIQFLRGKINNVSIKNRYNNSVDNPDATFSNNLDDIIPGLKKAFEKEYNYVVKNSGRSKFELLNYTEACDGKLYKYIYEIDDIYYCPDNIIIDHSEIIKLEKEKYILLDYFLLDLQHSTVIKLCEEEDGLEEFFQNITNIKISKSENTKLITITNKENHIIEIQINHLNQIISISNPYAKKIADNFMKYNSTLTKIDIQNAEVIGNNFMPKNLYLEQLIIPIAESIGENFLSENNNSIKILEIPKVKIILNDFFKYNVSLKTINMIGVEEIGDNCLRCNTLIKVIELHNVKRIGNNFQMYNTNANKVVAPLLEEAGDYFMSYNKNAKLINFMNVEKVGIAFFRNNELVEICDMANLKYAGDYFFKTNQIISWISFSNLIYAGNSFLENNRNLPIVYFPNVKYIGNDCLKENKIIREVYMPNATNIGNNYLKNASEISNIVITNVKRIGPGFIKYSRHIKAISVNNGVLIKGKKDFELCCFSQTGELELNKSQSKKLKRLKK